MKQQHKRFSIYAQSNFPDNPNEGDKYEKHPLKVISKNESIFLSHDMSPRSSHHKNRKNSDSKCSNLFLLF